MPAGVLSPTAELHLGTKLHLLAGPPWCPAPPPYYLESGTPMKLSIPLCPLAVLIALCAGLTLNYRGDAGAAEAPPQVSKDGLQLKTHTKQRVVYVKPGATFNQYDRVMILDCYVEFQKDWLQNYNANAGPDLSRRVTDA